MHVFFFVFVVYFFIIIFFFSKLSFSFFFKTNFTERLTCEPAIYLNEPSENQRFFCTICDKSYLRKRHLQRHMRDECIGIPPRFQCDHCPSKFRRKYHLVRHLNSKHGILQPNQPFNSIKSENEGYSSSPDNNVSINALLMKKENYEKYLPDLKRLEDIQKSVFEHYRNQSLTNNETLPFLNFLPQNLH